MICDFFFFKRSTFLSGLNKQRPLGFLHSCSVSFPVGGVIVWATVSSFCISRALTGFPGGSEGKASGCNARDRGSIPGQGRSPGEGNGNPLQYSCLENPRPGGAWWATVHGTARTWTRLRDFTFIFFHFLHLKSIEFSPHPVLRDTVGRKLP